MVEILPNETGLIVIDPQNGMCHPRAHSAKAASTPDA